MVRDFYAGSSVELAMVNGAFVLGTITSTVVLMRRAAVQRQGRAILVALIAGATLIGLFSLQPPQVLFYVMIYCFGSGAGVVMSIGRTIAQNPPALRIGRACWRSTTSGSWGPPPLVLLRLGNWVKWWAYWPQPDMRAAGCLHYWR